MKKAFILVPALAATAIIFTGCSMCTDPIYPSCREDSHVSSKVVTPNPIAFTAPEIVPTLDTFRPTFRAGDKRVSASGSGTSLEEATNDALMNFKKLTSCDYIVAVNIDVQKSTHPTWRIIPTTNYSVTVAGLPIYLDKLVREERKPAPVVVEKPVPPTPQVSKEDITIIIRNELTKYRNLGLLKLSDIDVQIKAKGHTADDVGVVFPAK